MRRTTGQRDASHTDLLAVKRTRRRGIALLLIPLLAGCLQAAESPDPVKRLRALEHSLPARPEDPALQGDWATLNFIVRKMKHAAKAYSPTPERERLLATHEKRARNLMRSLRENRAAPVKYGLLEEAYYCDTDESFQPFLRYLPNAAREQTPLPLLIFLHGYSPLLDIVNWSRLDPALIAFAEENDFMILAPFGRSNTDFQNTGELDVLRAIEEMASRYEVDRTRMILSGFSMGGMGVWTIGAHHPQAFAGLLPIAGRGDYYYWHGVSRDTLPSYKRDLIDAEFGYSMLNRLRHTPVFMLHGTEDSLIRVQEARHMAKAVGRINPNLIFIELEGQDHWIVEPAFKREGLRAWLLEQRRDEPIPELQYKTDLLPSSIGPFKRVFLDPFIFVGAGKDVAPPLRWHRALREWEQFTKSPPRSARETDLASRDLRRYHLVFFGEPETSPKIRRVLQDSPVTITKDHFMVGNLALPRKNHGLYLVRPSPWNPERRAVVQSGLHWGEGLPENHKYDLIPDFIVYSEKRDADGSNTALAAGFFKKDGSLDLGRIHVAEGMSADEISP